MRTNSLLSLLLLSSLCACSGSELVGVHVKLAADGSGTITTRALMPIDKATDAENRSKGVNWTIRAGLTSSQGTFSEVGTVTLGDGEVTFSPQLEGDRHGMRIHIQRGPKTKWIETLVPDQKMRQEMAKAYDPTGRTKEIGEVLRFEVAAPGNVITSGVLPTGRGVQADRDGKKATLLLPVRTAVEDGDAFVWDISWLGKK
tara:strand:+ start:21856 stop:22458 length:603 start_codon:yes stop_codon:yes gene_type:complete